MVTVVPILIGALGAILKGWKNWKSKDEPRLSKFQDCWGRPEYLEKSLSLGEACCHSYSTEKPSANAVVKSSQGV